MFLFWRKVAYFLPNCCKIKFLLCAPHPETISSSKGTPYNPTNTEGGQLPQGTCKTLTSARSSLNLAIHLQSWQGLYLLESCQPQTPAVKPGLTPSSYSRPFRTQQGSSFDTNTACISNTTRKERKQKAKQKALLGSD